MNDRILFFLGTEKGYAVLKYLLKNGYKQNIGSVVTFKESNVEKSWHDDIMKACTDNQISCYMWPSIRKDLISFIKEGKFCAAITISWIYLLPLEINLHFKYPLIVFHDSLLPKYRGFAPTPTAVINGENTIGLTALFASDDVDNGDIIEQMEYRIDDAMYIKEIINGLSNLYGLVVCNIVQKIANGEKIESRKQDESLATYSIWRNLEDCRLDWSQSSKKIYDFIRAVGCPYPGAFSNYNGKKIIIEKSEIIDDKHFEIRDYGKIWSIKNNCPEVICGEGMIRIINASYEDGSRVVFNRLRCRLK